VTSSIAMFEVATR